MFERSKIPLSKWWMAAHMFNSGKNGVSAHEIHRNLGVTYKTAWFMMHRLREAMNELNPTPMGGEGKSIASGRNLLRKHVETRERLPQGPSATRQASLR